ncbi:phosphotransferase family protein [Streptomyces xiangluensis]|uniref:Phosphotransferase family protein n=1 Tax=Streptomyces xiangluensis TaxID=2665720 RepID=A0ABV8Z546_9ACTN
MAEPSTASPAPSAVPPVAATPGRPSEAEPVTVREYGTRYLRITVRYHGSTGFSWLRAPGPAHTRPQRLPPVAVRAALRRVDTAISTVGSAGTRTGAAAVDRRDARLALGEWTTAAKDGGTRSSGRPGVLYRVPGAVSVARLLPSGDDTAFRLSVTALADVGRTLRRLHREPWELPERPPHEGVRRLLAWVSGEEITSGASRLRALARTRLGPSLWARLTDWSEAANAPSGSAGTVLLHGAPSTGWLIPSLAGGRTALLTGEEVTGGDPALDLGWLLGELHELRAAAARGLGSAGQGPPVDYPAAAHALLSGYTGSDGPAAVPRGTACAATLRLAVHMRDFASFVGWHEDLRHYCDLLAEALTEDGAPALRWATPSGFIEDSPQRSRQNQSAHQKGQDACSER